MFMNCLDLTQEINLLLTEIQSCESADYSERQLDYPVQMKKATDTVHNGGNLLI